MVLSKISLLLCLNPTVRTSPLKMAQKCYAAERNKQVILDVLEPRIENVRKLKLNHEKPLRILEIASGTGEHAALFAESLLNVDYQPTEPQINMHESITSWTSTLSNGIVRPPVAVDVLDINSVSTLPMEFRNNQVDVMICINMIHISHIDCTKNLFQIASQTLQPHGFLLTYGPYRVNNFMVESNLEFDRHLKSRNPDWGVRDLEVVTDYGKQHGFELVESITMPANNLCNIFKFCNVHDVV